MIAKNRSESPIGVLVADDCDFIRRAVRQILESESSIKVVGEASTFVELLQMVDMLNPPVVVTDLHMPDEQNFDPQFLRIQLLDSKVVAISIWDDEETHALAEKIGAIKLLDKSNLHAELIPAILHSYTGN
jgi:two-component system, NarL family, response regulator DegU